MASHADLRIACGDATLAAVLARPDRPADVLVVLAHGAGTTMSSPPLVAYADGLTGGGAATLRFNFPYAQRGRRLPDRAAVLESAYGAVLAVVRADPALRRLPLVIGGRSMGGRMASHLAAAGAAVDGLIFLGYPLHPAGKPLQTRAAHLPRIAVPMLFLTGTRDALAPLDALRPVLAGLPGATLHVVDGADHSFAVPRRGGRDAAAVRDELVAVSLDWLRTAVLGRPRRG